jgi:hypothetical protein
MRLLATQIHFAIRVQSSLMACLINRMGIEISPHPLPGISTHHDTVSAARIVIHLAVGD